MSWRRWAAIGLLIAPSLAVPAPARAQMPAAAPLSDALKGEAKQAYDAAKLLLADGDAKGALTKFGRAFELTREPRLLWNMAACEKELRHYANAAQLVKRYLNEGGSNISADSRAYADSTLRTLRSFYSELTLEHVPAGAAVSIDGVRVATTPLNEPLFVDLGARRLRVELDGFEPFERQVEVSGAEAMTVEVTLAPSTKLATLIVTSGGARDLISVDGKRAASREWRGSVPAGEHTIRVTADGKKPYETTIRLSANSSRTLAVSLEDRERTLWPWVVGGAAVLIGGGLGSYFLFKPEGSDPRGPQGKLTTVQLPAGSAR